MRLAIIIPALNESGNVRRLIGEIPSKIPLISDISIIVVDNGSTDNTAHEAHEVGAIVVQEPRRGYGYACAAGLHAADTAELLVFMDGDGSFDPAEISLLIQPIVEDRADLVFGSRAAHSEPGAMPPHQRFGNQLVSRLMGLLYSLKVTDLGPFRAIRRDCLLTLDMCEMTFGWPTEMMVKSARHGYRIVEVPVHYRKRWSGQSKVSGTIRGTLLATYFILGVTLRYAFMPNRSSNGTPKR
jgi:glycosyltransferase involved in cell wall biosynthesis